MKTHAKSADEALAALALVQAANDRSHADVRTILTTTPHIDLIAGMVTLVSSLAVSLAAATGVGPDIITDHLRVMLLEHGQVQP